ncbi:proline--tRNA ligase [Psittacicella melopsittaci]|uniref:Proline--tRNA ligase n=1 Tax=Psittacicella melopsittaci TaxID=2028576 RepID=A0A3A1Y4U9_9GAMM|nr:proline--tRNA ligase [Psittacicella melopsittaci]RIY32319.1 proline--tRNA ligase [Psittacicella melopsittaci]
MRISKYFLATLKEAPSEAVIDSHKIMIRAGMVRQLASGVYTWLPTGKRILNKVEQIVRREHAVVGSHECLATMVTPAELWIESGRYNSYGDNLLKFKDRKDADFVLGPTHEEVFTTTVKQEVFSYRQLPLNLYQIQTKFRDETRPRFGILRTREFIMADAYSFHQDWEDLKRTYADMEETYHRIFTACGLSFRAVEADNGSMGGAGSKEFQVLAEAGEDLIAYSDTSDYAANIEKAPALPSSERQAPTKEVEKVHTPGVTTIESLVEFGKGAYDASQTIKLVVVNGATEQAPLVAIALRGDHELNEVKAEHHPLIASPVTMANPGQIEEVFGAKPGSLGVINCPVPLIVDNTALTVSDFVTGANDTDYHYFGVNWDRDVTDYHSADLRNVVEGDPSPDGQGKLLLTRGCECGHVFMLGDKYSKSLNFTVTDENGQNIHPVMGCYGIGVTRVVAAAIEQNHDEWGCTLPDALVPFLVGLVPVNYNKSQAVRDFAEQFYAELPLKEEVYFDDRGERLGVALADIDLIGVPYQFIVGEKNLNNGQVEFKDRRTGEKELLTIEQAKAKAKALLENYNK